VIEMPCIECGDSAKEKHNGVVGKWIGYDSDGNAKYYCLTCTKEILKEQIEE